MLLIAYLVLKMISFTGKQQRENTNQENDFCVENPFGTVYLGTFFRRGSSFQSTIQYLHLKQ